MLGKLITFEGIDGCGKSTQAKILHENINLLNGNSVITREPGGSPGAEEIRKLLVKGAADRWSAETEILLFTAARRDHIERTILPALELGKVVISDRFFDSTKVYQGASNPRLKNLVTQLHNLIIKCIPDLTFVIDMDPNTALKRGLLRNSGEDRFEELGIRFHEKLRNDFIELTRTDSSRCVLIDGTHKIEIIAKEIWTHYVAFNNG